MRFLSCLLLCVTGLSLAFSSTLSFAEREEERRGERNQEQGGDIIILQERREEPREGVFNSPLDIRLQGGAVSFDDTLDEDTSRFVSGIGLNLNLARLFKRTNLYTGLSTGVLYSRLGGADASFFGADPAEGEPRTNLYSAPLNLQIGYQLLGFLFLGAQGGAYLTYQTNAGTVDLGRDVAEGESAWNFFPSAGVTTGISLGENVGLFGRGDWVFTDADDLLYVTAGLAFALR
jgi:hypothetical protein